MSAMQARGSLVAKPAHVCRAIVESASQAAAERMAEELFALVERDAGYAHISDGIDILSEKELLNLAAKSRDLHERCAKKLNAFVLHHANRIVLGKPYRRAKRWKP